MKKKIFGFVLLGAFTMFALSAITSCKKYDDDVDNLQSQISANQLAFEQAKSALESTVTGLQSQLEAARSDVSKNAALIAGLEARLATAEAALNSLKDIPETLAALGVKVDGVKTTVDGLSSTVTNEVNERKAADIAIQTQIDALERLAKDGDAALQGQIDKIIEQLKQIDVNKGDIETLKTDLQKASDEVAKFDGRINTLEDLLGSSVRSLVFVPDYYYYGIEAAELKTMNYEHYAMMSVDADKDGEFNLTTITGKKVPCNPSTDKTHLRYNTTKDFSVQDFTATYHVNPASAKFEDATYKLLSDDKQYTRSAAAGLYILENDPDRPELKLAPYRDEQNDLVVTLGVKNKDAVKKIAATGDSYVTVFATEVTLPTADKKDTYTVTSDYAAVRAVQIGGYRLSNVCKAVGNENKDATAAERKTMTGVLNTNACGNCTYPNPDAGLHMFSTFEECAYPAGKNVQPAEDMATTKKEDAQAYVMWNEELDLLRLVETHYVDKDEPVKMKDFNANYLSYKFEIVGSFYGTNATSEGAHAIIKDGHIFRPQMPTEAGKQDKNIGTQAVTTVGRQPVVRVQLIYEKCNPETHQKTQQVLDYGYIRIKIVDKPVEPKPDEFIEFTTSYSVNYGCPEQTTWKEFKWSNTWDEVEYMLYHDKLNISHETFLAHYKPVKAEETSQVSEGPRDLAQYKKGSDGKFVLCTDAEKSGSLKEEANAGGAETNTLNWTITGDDMRDAYINKLGTTSTLARAIKYQSDDEHNYPSVYVLVTGTIKIGDGKVKGTIDLDPHKLANYWYKHNSILEGSGKDEARINVPVPEEGKTTVASPLESTLASQFVGNEIDAESMLKYTDNTDDKAFARNKLTYDLVFDVTNTGKEFLGQNVKNELDPSSREHVVYELSVDETGKELKANVKGKPAVKETIAKLVGSDINWITLAYQHGTFAEDLLNYSKYNEMSDKTLLAVIAIQIKNGCGKNLDLTGNTFNERFVRPINVDNGSEEITDAKDKEQPIFFKNLVKLSDWRGYWFADHVAAPDYWSYYNIKSIAVRGANPGDRLSRLATTNMDGGDINTTILNTKSDRVEFYYHPKTPDTPSATADYGYIGYTNNGNNVQTFSIQLPIRVTYEWGYIDTYVTIKVNKTQGTGSDE